MSRLYRDTRRTIIQLMSCLFLTMEDLIFMQIMYIFDYSNSTHKNDNALSDRLLNSGWSSCCKMG